MTESVQQMTEREAEGEGAPPPRTVRARLLPTGAMLLIAALFFALTLAVSLTKSWNADTSNVTLQGWDLVHGQVLLNGWWATDVNFYTFDLPIYGLSVLVFGLGGLAPHVAGAVIYTIVFLAACWLAKGRSQGSAFWLRVALVALFMTSVLFEGALIVTQVMVPDHSGTVVFMLVGYVLYSRYADRRWGPWAMLAVLTLGQISDVSVRYILVASLVFVWAVDHLRQRRLRTPESWMALAALASVPLSLALRTAMIHMGAYYLAKAHTSFAPVSTWGWHFSGMYQSLLALYGVYIHGFPGASAGRVAITVISGGALVCGVLSLLRALIRWTKVDAADRLLAVSILVYLAAYQFSTVAAPGGGGGYEFIGVIAMFSVLSARAASSLRPFRLPAYRTATTAVAGLGAFVFLLSGTAIFQTPQKDQLQTVASWLQEHNLNYGLAGYWNSSPITVYSGGAVAVRPIELWPNGIIPRMWNARQQWYDASKYDARFVVTEQDPHGAMTAAQTEASLGKPAAEYQVDQYTILVYSYNLLTKVQSVPLAPGD